MPVDHKSFSGGLTLLCNHFDRQLQPEVVRIWKEYFDKKLTTSQFEAAVTTLLLESRFFPTAKELVEAAKGSDDVIAQGEWEKCLAAAARGESANALGLSPQGQFALRSIGGVYQLGLTEESKHDWKRKEFVSAWKSYTPSVSQAQQEIPLQAGDSQFTGIMQQLSRKTNMNGNGSNHK